MNPHMGNRYVLPVGLVVLSVFAACSSSSSSNGGGVTDGGVDEAGVGADSGASDGGEVIAETCTVGAPGDALSVATTRGLVRGQAAGSAVSFLGIPYASSPTGARRFQPPVKKACWSDVKAAAAFGSSCPQPEVNGGKLIGAEDCLFLNVWTPAVPASGASGTHPVLFWIHGGSQLIGAGNFSSPGAGNTNSYDGQAIATAQNAVVVSVNYRLGALGFLAHPALDAESPKKVSGNYGLLDQIAGLTWVKDNVSKFGGDPAKVMVFGESAGAWNTCAIVASPLAKGLFSAAAMESGVCVDPTLKSRETKGATVATALKCDTATDVSACLRGKSIADMVAQGPFGLMAAPTKIDFAHLYDLDFGPNVDGWALLDSPIAAIKKGTHNKVPLLIGTNANEYDLFQVTTSIPTCAVAKSALDASFDPAVVTKLGTLYPCTLDGEAKHVVSDIVTDLLFTCPARRASRAMVAQGTPVYRYFFTHSRELDLYASLRAYHSAEIPFVFHTLGGADQASAGELGLADAMSGYWARFAGAGDPGGGAAPAWEKYDTARDNAIVLEDTISAMDGVHTTNCDYWDTLAVE